MKNKIIIATTLVLFFLPFLWKGSWAGCQNIGINTTGVAPAATNMLEVLQPSTTASSVGIYSNHTGAIAAGTGYAFQALKSGASLNNIAAYLSASGATNNYALIVPSGGGRVGIGTSAPVMMLDVTGSSTTLEDATIRGASTGNAAVYGIWGTVTSTTATAAGVRGSATGNAATYGVFGDIPATNITANAAGVRGFAAGGAGDVYGVFGENNATGASSAAVRGLATGSGGKGILGQATGAGISYGVYGKSESASDGVAGVFGYNITTGANTGYGIDQIRAGAIGRHDWGQSYHFGVAGYVFNDLLTYPYGGVIGAATVANNPAVWGSLGYRESGTTEYAGFFNGNSRTTGYMLVGNPVAPSSTAGSTSAIFYSSSLDAGAAGWSQTRLCGALSTAWTFSFTSSNGVLTYDNAGTRSYNQLFTPMIWIPAGVTSITNEGHFSCTLEDSFDGVFLESSINGGAWTKVTVFSIASYNDVFVEGTNTICTANNTQSAWTAGGGGTFNGPFRCAVGTAGNWVQFRFVGMEDGANATGLFNLFGFSVGGILPATVGGPFTAGNIYAEKNVYAGSNALIGDLAEYFKVDVQTEPGDLIAMKSTDGNEYTVSDKAYNPYVIGIHSTNPTVTLNQPSGAPVCLTGRVPVKTSGENGIIQIGDYLTAASVKGYAMKADKPCFIIGRALENFSEKGTGKILCMVETGWFNPSKNSNQSGGRFFIKNNNSTVIVNDVSVKEDSRIFITLRDNAGGHWVSNVSEGSFIVNITKPSEKIIPFDYFIDNATPVNSANQGNLVSKDEKKKAEEITSVTSTDTTSMIKKIPLPEYTGEMPPGNPPNPENGWIWSKATGFKMTADLSALKKVQENNNNQQLSPKDTIEK